MYTIVESVLSRERRDEGRKEQASASVVRADFTWFSLSLSFALKPPRSSHRTRLGSFSLSSVLLYWRRRSFSVCRRRGKVPRFSLLRVLGCLETPSARLDRFGSIPIEIEIEREWERRFYQGWKDLLDVESRVPPFSIRAILPRTLLVLPFSLPLETNRDR